MVKEVHASGEELTVHILIEILRSLPDHALIKEAILNTDQIYIKYELREDHENV